MGTFFKTTTKWIPVEEGIPEEEYRGYRTFDDPTCNSYCAFTYLGNGQGYCFKRDDDIIQNISHLLRPLTEEEIKGEAKREFKNLKNYTNLIGLYENLYSVGDAYHEMYNAWFDLDFYQMDRNLKNHNWILIGIAEAPRGWSLNEKPVAVVVEDMDNQERFWCHAAETWIEKMRKEMQELVFEIAGEGD